MRDRFWSVIGLAAFCLGALNVVDASEPMAWQIVDDGDPSPGPWSLAYDSARDRLVLIVGPGHSLPAPVHPPHTWELVGEDWVRRFPPEPTPWNSGACMAYDPVRGVTVAFGGFFNNETWEYDGSVWVKRTFASQPSERTGCAMVYDSARARMVMFGGRDYSFNNFGDTWEYDGTQWILRTFRTSPSARDEPALAYDSAREVVVLFAGRISNGLVYQDTWEYDGTRWREENPSTNPLQRAAAAMAYDPIRGKTVLFGGYTPLGPYGDTWEWDGTDWTPLSPPNSPDARRRMRLVWHAGRGKLVGFGGEPADRARNDTWEFDGLTWTRIALPTGPGVRGELGFAYDPSRDELVLYGGWNHYETQDEYEDTWRYVDGAWSEDLTVGTTTTDKSTPLTFDPVAGEIIGFSGSSPTSAIPPSDVHRLTGAPQRWVSQSFCCPEPDGRVTHAIAFAQPLGGLFVFAGRAANDQGCCYIAGDTWLFNGATWQQEAGGAPPAARYRHAAAYDSQRTRILMYGGLLTNNEDVKESDLWIYDASGWMQLAATSPPGPRAGHGLSYDSGRDRIVLYGSGAALDGVTWEFDGQTWASQPTTFQPDPTRCSFGLQYDGTRQVTWLFGGHECKVDAYFGDLWAYGPDPDGDGKVGGLDNCREIANPSQANADGDPAGDDCDCAPSDPGGFAPPVEVTGLRADGPGPTTVSWDDQAGSTGSGARYDLASGSLSFLHSGGFGDALCLANDLGAPSYSDTRTPVTGDGFYYVARSQNPCGNGTYGRAGLDQTSPCP